MLTLEQFNNYLNKLAAHDWFYEFSDDNNVWRSGKDARQALLDGARQHPSLYQAFTAWGNCVFSEGDPSQALLAKENIISQLRREITEPKE